MWNGEGLIPIPSLNKKLDKKIIYITFSNKKLSIKSILYSIRTKKKTQELCSYGDFCYL